MAILGKDRVEGVKFIKTRTNDGKIENVSGSEFTQPCDLVIRATGQEKKIAFLKDIEGLEIDSGGRIVVDKKSFRTGNSAYFAGGDVVSGGAEVVNAAYEGKTAARGILEYLSEGENND